MYLHALMSVFCNIYLYYRSLLQATLQRKAPGNVLEIPKSILEALGRHQEAGVATIIHIFTRIDVHVDWKLPEAFSYSKQHSGGSCRSRTYIRLPCEAEVEGM